MESNQMFLVGNDDFTTILPTLDQVELYVPEVLKSILERKAPIDLRIRTRPARECRLFIDGTGPSPQPVVKEPAQTPRRFNVFPAKKTKKTTVDTAVPAKTHKAAKVRTGSNRSVVLECINKCTESNAIDCAEICKRTKLSAATVSPMLSEFFKAGLVDRINGRPLKFFRLEAGAAAKQQGSAQINCPARGKPIAIDTCKPNDASPVCRGCENYC